MGREDNIHEETKQLEFQLTFHRYQYMYQYTLADIYALFPEINTIFLLSTAQWALVSIFQLTYSVDLTTNSGKQLHGSEITEYLTFAFIHGFTESGQKLKWKSLIESFQ